MTGATTNATCITSAPWIFSDFVQGVQRATVFTASAEDWKNGTRFIASQTTFGVQPTIAIVGGISAMLSYGMGRWNPHILEIDSFGQLMS